MNLSERIQHHTEAEHPSVEQLKAFALDQLGDDDSTAVEHHLTVCETCLALLETTPEDALAVLIRHAHSLVLTEPLPAVGPSQALRSVPGYTLLERLGEGGMGVVWKARHEGLNRLVALKRLRSVGTASAETLARFRREAESVARLQHPNIVQIYDIGEHDGEPYLALEYVGGGSLAQKLAAGPLPPSQAATLVETLARAMHYAHQQGIIHRDLKPGNVLLTDDGTPKISDFGLAKQLDAATAHTQTGAVLRTPSYMAPEQAECGQTAIGPAADIYTLGAILYETLTGRPPFRGPTVLDTLAQVREREPVPLRQLQPSVPRDLQIICLKCLHKDPRRRYGSALDLAEDLRRFAGGEPIRARPVGRLERLLKWVRRRPHLALLAVFLFLGPLGASAALLWHNDRLQKETSRAQTAEQNAQDNYAKSRQTLLSILDQFDHWLLRNRKDEDRMREGITQDCLAYIQTALDKDDKNDPQVRQDAARLLVEIGRIQWYYGRREEAHANFVRAFSLWEQLCREHPEDKGYFGEMADCCRILGFFGDGRQLEWLEKALQMAEETYRREPDTSPWPHTVGLAQCHNDLGVSLFQGKRLVEAEDHFQQAIGLYTRVLERLPDHRGCQLGLADSHDNLGCLFHRTHRLKLAESEFRRADELLAALMPQSPEARVSRSNVALDWGNLYLEMRQIDNALASFDRGIAWCEDFLLREPNYAPARENALKLHDAKAQTYDTLKRYAEAAGEWKRVVELAEGEMRLMCRMARGISLAHSGDSVHAAAEADAVAAEPGCSLDALYNCACVYALSGRADKAVSLLSKLRSNGFFENAGHLKNLRTDIHLDPLRQRDDFVKLVNAARK